MDDLIRFTILGLPLGCVYALVATGLVLTYKTSGVFNLAFGAQAYVSAAIFYDTRAHHDWPVLPAFLLAVVVVGPLIGLVLYRALFRHMRASWAAVRLVSALGLLVAIPAVVQLWFGSGVKYGPPSLAPDPDRVFRWGTYAVTADQIVTVVATLAVVALLGALFRFTALGLQMRAVVESPRMVELAGINADRVSAVAWMLSSFMAALAGVLLAPLFATVDAANFTILIVAAIAAAAFGRLSSLPLTLAGGILLGVSQQVLAGFLPLNSVLAQGLRPSFPFLMLFLLLLFWPGLRARREAADPLAGVDPPPPALAASYRDERLDRLTRLLFPAFLATFMGVSLFALPGFWLFIVTVGIVYSIIFLSVTVLTGMAGLVSLCQATFAGVGAFTAAQLATRHGLPILAGMLVGAAVAAAVGALIAIPALRLGGLSLALGTLAFALMVDNVVFPLDWVGGGQSGVDVPRPVIGSIDFSGDRAFFLLAMAVFALAALAVILVRRGTTGRFLAALRGSELAASAIGINPTRAKITAFALSAGIAGLGGGLLASLQGRTSPDSFGSFFGLFWVVLVLTIGARTVEGAVNAGMGLALFPQLLQLLHAPITVQFVLFGFGAITFAKHPEGIVEAQKRRSIEAQVRRRARRAAARATDAAAAAPAPRAAGGRA